VTQNEIWKAIGIALAAVALVLVVAWRRRTQARFFQEFAEREVCPHLRSALELLRSRGHVVVRAGQRRPEFPLEIYIAPGFDPSAICAELKLEEPVAVSERNVLICREDWCELHPVT
jgi:hypothetical protein